MTQLLKRPLLFALVLIFILTGAALMTSKGTNAPAVSKSASNVAVQQSPSEGMATQTQAPEPEPKPLSPYDIEYLIKQNPEVSLKDRWLQLHVYPDFGDGEDPTATEPFLETCNGCEAEMFEYDLDDQPGKEVLLRIEDRMAESCRYLVFMRLPSQSTEEKWKLLGHIDWGLGKYRMPQHSVVVSGGRTWLLVEVADGSGSGYSHYSYRLFKVESSGVKELLSFPSEGYQSWCGPFPVQDFSSRVINCSNSGELTTVEVEFYVAYHLEQLLKQSNKRR